MCNNHRANQLARKEPDMRKHKTTDPLMVQNIAFLQKQIIVLHEQLQNLHHEIRVQTETIGNIWAAVNHATISAEIEKEPVSYAPRPQKRPKKYTTGDDLVLREMHQRGATVRDIADTLNRTWHSVDGRVKRLKRYGQL